MIINFFVIVIIVYFGVDLVCVEVLVIEKVEEELCEVEEIDVIELILVFFIFII